MKIAGMQPYFFPYIGYWQLIHAADVFVIYDDGKMISNGWIHRNRILEYATNTPRTITIPIKNKSVNHAINEMERVKDERLMRKLIKMIEINYLKARHYQEVMPMIRDIILNDEMNMAKYLTHSLHRICDYLQIKTRFVISSTIDKTGLEHFDDKAERIFKTIGITNWINPIGGMEYYNKEAFAKRGIQLSYIKRRDCIRYEQFGGEFVPDLSIIDMLMFCSVEEIQQKLNEYDIV